LSILTILTDQLVKLTEQLDKQAKPKKGPDRTQLNILFRMVKRPRCKQWV
jgi:hypothetical protein